MIMKRLSISTIIIILCAVSNIYAQQSQTTTTNNEVKLQSDLPPDAITWANERTENLNEFVALTADQKFQVTEINLRFARRMEALKNSNTGSEQIQQSKENLYELRTKEYSKVLTEEQNTQLKKVYFEMKAQDMK